jgi:hypothetical protein
MRDDGITFEGERADGLPTHMVIDGERVALPTHAEIAATEEREEREISEHWDQYYALTFGEKIRQEGVVSWLLHTNTGITVSVVSGLVLGLALVSVLASLGLSR